MLTEAVQLTFNDSYVNPNFRNLHCSIEFPMKKQNYPGVWVDYSPAGPLTPAGIGHKEYVDTEFEFVENPLDPSGPPIQIVTGGREVKRWKFQGEVSYTLVAMTSQERDSLHDEFVRMLAFGDESSSTSVFRQYIESNDWVNIGINFDFDEVVARGFNATPGTPWQTDEMIYECEIVMECVGEFLSDPQGAILSSISSVVTYPYEITEGGQVLQVLDQGIVVPLSDDTYPYPTDNDGWQ